MAEKRMFSRRIIESDSFMQLSLQAQALYLHLNLNADDDGVVDNTISVMRLSGTDEQALDELVETGYVLMGLPGVYVITHWGIHNSIPKKGYKPTIHQGIKVNLVYEDDVWKIRSR